ncbi:MAG: class I SAM-dependent methyltransferase [Patescibacteria group bacterium]
MYKKPLKKLPKFLFSLYANQLIKSYPNYQPIFKNGKLIMGGDRNCLDRWGLIKKEIDSCQANSVLDIGCAEGFYVLQSARECGCVSLGVDADIRRLSMAQNQIASEKIMPAGFVLAEVDSELIKKLPEFDIVIFMSVMHHMMYSSGEEYSRSILKEIRKKVKKAMIFEMGQSNELKNRWAKLLPDMGENPHEWIKNFILSAGFSKVEKIGESDSYSKDQNRAIFRVEP